MNFEKIVTQKSDKDNISKKEISRRKFLSILAGVGVGVAALKYPSLEKIVREAVNDKNELNIETESLVEKIKTQYGFEVSFIIPINKVPQINSSEDTYIIGELLNELEKRDAVLKLFLEMSVYPREYIDQIGLKKVTLVNNLRLTKLLEAPKIIQKTVGGFIDAQGDLYINFSAGFMGWLDNDQAKKGIHHELYHLADYKDDGGVDVNIDKWVELNPEKENDYNEFKSNDGLIKKRKKEGEGYVDGVKRRLKHSGFSNTYGMSNVAEDKATTAEGLLTNYREIMGRCINDKVLAEKVKQIKIDYYKWTQGKFDDVFWGDLEKGKVKTDYWDSRR